MYNKEEFKKDIKDNCKLLYRKNIDECDDQQKFQAVAYSVKNIIIDKWIATHKEYEKQDVKIVCYMSMEFLMGRALGNNMINLMAYDEIKEVLAELVQIAEKYRRDFLPGEFHTLEILETL